MKGHNAWSYHPYRPFLTDVGDIYVCRIAPGKESIHLEWLPCGTGKYSVFCHARGEDAFVKVGDTLDCVWDITGLNEQADYEFYVSAGEKKSRVRLARTGEVTGTVVNYLHPEDEAYAFSGRYLCSPSLLRHPDGYLLASMDVYAAGHPQNLTIILRSDDEGATWHYVSELMPCFWGKLFLHRGELYMLGCSTEYGDLLIGKSSDGGKTFSTPVTLLRGSNGKKGNCGVHKNPQPLLNFDGRLYGTLEWGAWANKEYCHAAMVMSCDENADLLDPESWHFTPPVRFDRFAPELEDMPLCTMTIEGTMVASPDGRLLNVMRFAKYGKALVYEVNTTDPDAPLCYSHLMDFSANLSKFTIKYDAESGCWWTIACRLYDREKSGARNLLSLMRSRDMKTWEVVSDLIDRREMDHTKVGFQYVDFLIEGNDMIFLCRTAWNGANDYHDSNYSTFHRIPAFRDL